jgi:hypothetical protein
LVFAVAFSAAAVGDGVSGTGTVVGAVTLGAPGVR